MQEFEDRDWSLRSVLRAVAADDASDGTSPAVEAKLMAKVRSIALARRRRKYAIVFALAAALFAAVAVPMWRMGMRHSLASTVMTGTGASVDASGGEITTTFLPLIYSNVPLTDGQIVRLEVPRAALETFGLAPLDSLDGEASGAVLADVLIGEDGLARAVRFVHRAAPKKETR
jgi:hypothetical protein